MGSDFHPELLKALVNGDREAVEMILGNDASGDQVTVPVPTAGAVAAAPRPSLLAVTVSWDSALHLGARHGHQDLVDVVCQIAPSLVAARNKRLDTPLHCAARAGHRDVVDRLIRCARDEGRCGGDRASVLRARNLEGATALYEAVRHKHAEVVELLMQADPEVAAVTNEAGISPLYLAAMLGSHGMVSALLRPSEDGTPSPASYAGPEGRTALHAAAYVGLPGMTETILDWKPTLTREQDRDGSTSLHYAVSVENDSVIKLLLRNDTSVIYISDKNGLFPVHIAAIMESTGIIDILMEACSYCDELVDNQGRNFLHCAIENKRVKVVRHICKNSRFTSVLNATDYKGNTPLHLSIEQRESTIVRLLIEHKRVDLAISNMEGQTPRDLVLYHWDDFGDLMNPEAQIDFLLSLTRALESPHRRDYLISYSNKPPSEEVLKRLSSMSQTGALASVLITTLTFAAAFTMPGGYVADTGTPTVARKLAFKAFLLSNTFAFALSTLSTVYLIYGGTTAANPDMRKTYLGVSWMLLFRGVRFMIAAFAFGVHSVLSLPTDRWIVVVVGLVAAVSVLFINPAEWTPLFVMKAVRIRRGWIDVGMLSLVRVIMCGSMYSLLIGGSLLASTIINVTGSKM